MVAISAGLELQRPSVFNNLRAADFGRTVAVHRANMMDTLGIHKAADLVVYAIRNGLVDLP